MSATWWESAARTAEQRLRSLSPEVLGPAARLLLGLDEPNERKEMATYTIYSRYSTHTVEADRFYLSDSDVFHFEREGELVAAVARNPELVIIKQGRSTRSGE